ncbi:uncharacterized protein LOC131804338 [Musca domestica]|uniref:Uncharacterized protein LOC131803363 n=1 Tax=Musca domestica TaxID=7370 RepID=A0ABM3VBD8_MUSDO|nr:uncharacterized protein LOC131803363 [Musca domestica]XP_058983101.1 uncharacterized protein LOC131804338 [Musca domestica]
MENLGKMAATLPDYEDDVPMSDEERELDAMITPISDEPMVTGPPEAVPPSEENLKSENPSTTVPEAPSGDTVVTPPSSAPCRSNQGSSTACVLCDGKHHLRDCKEFRVMRIERRLRTVALHRCCGNCLASTHSLRDCTSRRCCTVCNKQHHTLLHQPSLQDKTPVRSSLQNHPNNSKPSKKLRKRRSSKRPSANISQLPILGPGIAPRHNAAHLVAPRPVSAIQSVATLGPTMVVQVIMANNRIPVRALLDPCAGHSLICRSLADCLGLCPVIVGPERFCQLSVASSYDGTQRISLSARVINLAHLISPSESVSEGLKDHYAGLQLADPRFYETAAVSLVLGPEVYHKVMKPQTYSSPGFPWAQLTIFGWVISGPCNI